MDQTPPNMNWKNDFQAELDTLLAKAKRFDLEIQAEWGDEYGGRQSVILGPGDKLVFRVKQK